MLYKMLTGAFPYQSDSEEQYNLRMQNGDVQIESIEWTNLKPPKVLIDLIKGMLNTNMFHRFTAEKCIKSLDKWIDEMRDKIKE
jgi:serine/threonine protein kinase